MSSTKLTLTKTETNNLKLNLVKKSNSLKKTETYKKLIYNEELGLIVIEMYSQTTGILIDKEQILYCGTFGTIKQTDIHPTTLSKG